MTLPLPLPLPVGDKAPKCVHREPVALPDGSKGPMIAYWRAGLNWELYWRSEADGTGGPDGFRSLVDARSAAERHFAELADELAPVVPPVA